MEGERLGKYEIRRPLGRGAMGTVYEGWDPQIERKVAIKTVKRTAAEDAEAQEQLARFKREAQAAGRLQHPNIVGVFDYGETEDLAYIVMEFVDGESLKAVLDRGERFALDDSVRVFGDLLTGLGYSHERGVVHRDIKPANVMLTRDGAVKIADFGIARIESSSMTQAGTVLGSPAYMSPEQFRGETVDARTDIYSAGVVLYQLLTGERPFDGGFTAIMHKVLSTVPPKPSDLSVTAPVPLDGVVAKAMAKRPNDRFPTAAAFSDAIKAALGGAKANSGSDQTIIATGGRAGAEREAAAEVTTRASQPGGRARGRTMLPVWIGAAVIVAVIIIGGGAWLATRGPATPAQRVAKGTNVPLPAPAAAPAAAPEPAPSPVEKAVAVPHSATLATAPAHPSSSAAAAPVAVALAKPSTTAVRKAIAAALTPLSCTLIDGSLAGSQTAELVALSGVAGAGAPMRALHRAITEAAPDATIDWGDVHTFTDPAAQSYCRATDLARPSVTPFGAPRRGFSLSLVGGHTTLVNGDPIVFRLTMPDFGAWLTLDYFSSDGSVAHLHQMAAKATHKYDPGETVVMGRKAGWTAGPPYGQDMILAIASATPLFSKPRPESETADAYLAALGPALAAARASGKALDAKALLLETRAKPQGPVVVQPAPATAGRG